jgi:hypothetical protein
MSQSCDTSAITTEHAFFTVRRRQHRTEGRISTMNRSVLSIVAVGAVVTACAGGTREAGEDDPATTTADAQATTSAASTTAPTTAGSTSVQTTEAPPSTASAAGGGTIECLTGTWTLSAITGGQLDTRGFELDGAVAGVTLGIAPDTWELTASDATVGVSVGGTNALEVTLDGTASGTLVSTDDQVGLRLVETDGDASASVPGGEDLTFDYVIAGLVPTGQASFTCDPTMAVLTSGPTELTLTRDAPVVSDTTVPATAPSDAATIVIDTSAIPVVRDCDFRPVEIIAASTNVTLTGDCPMVTVSGIGNVVDIERVDALIVTGTGNEIQWGSGITGAAPQVIDNEMGNEITHG